MAKEKQTKTAKAEDTGLAMWGQYEGNTGFEAVTSQDLGVPFLTVLQALSPQLNKKKPEFVEGVSAGDIFNTLTKQAVWTDGDEPLEFIPMYYERLWVEWTPRNSGGGLVQIHTNASVLTRTKRNDKNEDIIQSGDGKGNVIVTTGYLHVLYDLKNEEGPQRALIGFASTQLKKAQHLLNTARAIRVNGRPVPLFSHVYKMSSQAEGNSKGDWNGWKIELSHIIADPELGKTVIAANKETQANGMLMLQQSMQRDSENGHVSDAELDSDETPF